MDELLVNTIYSFLLITIRFSGIFLVTPLYSSQIIPIQVKSGLSLISGFILYPIIFQEGAIPFPDSVLEVIFNLVNELLIGLILGFSVFLIFSALQLAGQLLDLRMGFAMVNVIDPFTGSNAPLIGQFKNILAILLFLIINGHQQIIRALVASFKILPLTRPFLTPELMGYIFRIAGDIFLIGLRLALPVMAVLFIVDVVFGFLARTVPQMNVFILGFPLKILIGFLILLLSMPFMIEFLIDILQSIDTELANLLKLMKP